MKLIIITPSDQSLQIHSNQNWKDNTGSKFRLCEEGEETVDHLISCKIVQTVMTEILFACKQKLVGFRIVRHDTSVSTIVDKKVKIVCTLQYLEIVE